MMRKKNAASSTVDKMVKKSHRQNHISHTKKMGNRKLDYEHVKYFYLSFKLWKIDIPKGNNC